MKVLLVVAAALLLIAEVQSAAKRGADAVEELDDLNEVKKLLKTKTNVMILVHGGKVPSTLRAEFGKAANNMVGKGAFAILDCSAQKKICKHLKVEADSEATIKHFKTGKFNKDYDRQLSAKSIQRFVADPDGDVPWDEDESARNVVHLTDATFDKTIAKKKPTFVMFYAPWCGHCKTFKPILAEIADEVKGRVIVAGIDANSPEGNEMRRRYNVTGFPKVLYFDQGEEKFEYTGERKKDAVLEWLNNPREPEPPAPPVPDFPEDSDVVVLNDDTFDTFLTENPQGVLVFFYAPWCGHCKNAKPELMEAATELKEEGVERKIAAVDCTVAKKLAKRFDVSGFPTIKYFANGKFKSKFEGGRKKDDFAEFLRNPDKAPAAPAAEPSWADGDNKVDHLTDENFESFLKKKKIALVMFYAPWCGHCKNAKPEYEAAAEQIPDERRQSFAAVDATVHKRVAALYEVKGFPAFKVLSYGKYLYDYNGGRKTADFLEFINNPTADTKMPEAPPPSGPQWSDEESDVVHLVESEYEAFRKENPTYLTMYYAPWCGHCKAMKPAYAEAATILKGSVPLTAVDCTRNRGLCEKAKVEGYPTLKFANGATTLDFDGERTTDGIVNYIRSKTGGAGSIHEDL